VYSSIWAHITSFPSSSSHRQHTRRLVGTDLALSEPTRMIGDNMIQFLRQWVALLDQNEKDLREQGYITVHGGCTSIVVRVGVRRRKCS
jgi:hypothetical protein